MKEEALSRQEARAVLTHPESTQEQKLRAKLVLVKHIANTPTAIQEIIAKYQLSPEQAARILAGRPKRSLVVEAWAKEEVKRLELSLAQWDSTENPL